MASNAHNLFNAPPGAVARVRIIDCTSRIIRLPVSFLMQPPLHGMQYMPDIPTWSFLIESPTGKRALFDLGVPPNFLDLSPVNQSQLRNPAWEIHSEKHVADILKESQIDPASINSIIWRSVLCLSRPLGIRGFQTDSLILVTGISTILEIPRPFPAQRSWLSVLGSRRSSIPGTRLSKMLLYGKVILRGCTPSLLGCTPGGLIPVHDTGAGRLEKSPSMTVLGFRSVSSGPWTFSGTGPSMFSMLQVTRSDTLPGWCGRPRIQIPLSSAAATSVTTGARSVRPSTFVYPRRSTSSFRIKWRRGSALVRSSSDSTKIAPAQQTTPSSSRTRTFVSMRKRL